MATWKDFVKAAAPYRDGRLPSMREGSPAMYVSEDGIPMPGPERTGLSPSEGSGQIRKYEDQKYLDEATKALGYSPQARNIRRGIGGAIMGLATLGTAGALAAPLFGVSAPSLGGMALASGAATGLGTGISEGSVSKGLGAAAIDGAGTYLGGKILGGLISRYPKTMGTVATTTGVAFPVASIAKGEHDARKAKKELEDAYSTGGMSSFVEDAIRRPSSKTPADWKLLMSKRDSMPMEVRDRLNKAYDVWKYMPVGDKWRPEESYIPAYKGYLSEKALDDIAKNWDYMRNDQREAFLNEMAKHRETVWNAIPEERRATLLERFRDIERKENGNQIARR